MAHRLNRAHLVRAAVAVAAVAVPLGAAGSAQAAIAGASPASTTALPDLVSATSTGTSSISVCFDKALGANSPVFSSANYDDLYVTNYLSGTTLEASTTGGAATGGTGPLYPTSVTANTSNPDCINVQFNPESGQLSLGQGTAVTSLAGAVTAASGGGQSLPDSTTLTSSTSHVGTTGVTAGPDLSSTAIYTGSVAGYTNALTYTFDQPVDSGTVNPADFYYETSSGTPATTTQYIGSGTALVSGNTVTIEFTGGSVKNALQTGVTPGAVYSVVAGNTTYEVTNQNNNQPLTGTGTGTVSNPTLVSAALANNYTAVTYTFDHTVNTTINVADFSVALSDGSSLPGTGDPYSVSGNTVTVTYGTALSNVAEYAVQANVASGAVALPTVTPSAGTPATAGTTTVTNTPSDQAIGGNSGAFARGFTTGADVVSATSEGNGVVQIVTDQRVAGFTTAEDGRIDLLNSAGQTVDTAQGTVESGAPAPGQEVIDITFSPTITSGTQLEFLPEALETNLDNNNFTNIPQIVSISGGSAARVHAAHAKHHVKKHSKKHAKKKA